MDNVNIIIPVFNATEFVIKCINSIREKTDQVHYSITVVDNASEPCTNQILNSFLLSKKIDILCSLEENRFWSEANNIGEYISPTKSNKLLLLNSDVEILDSLWLKRLLDIHEYGYTSYGVVHANSRLFLPTRGDGYCGLIDRDLYKKYKLDINFPWWFSISKLQSQIMRDGYSVQAIKNHDSIIKHYGGKSTTIILPANCTSLDPNISKDWFLKSKGIKIINDI